MFNYLVFVSVKVGKSFDVQLCIFERRRSKFTRRLEPKKFEFEEYVHFNLSDYCNFESKKCTKTFKVENRYIYT